MNFRQTPNISQGMNNKKYIVIHGTLGNYEGAVNWLCTPPEKRPTLSYSSAHLVIGREQNQITQLADVNQITWHCGTVSNPTYRARKYLTRKLGALPLVPVPASMYSNPNSDSIGIELEWFPGQFPTDWQFEQIIKFVKNNKLTPVFLSHSEITDYKSDFGRDEKGMLVVQELIRRYEKSL